MTTITYPTSQTSNVVVGAIAAALAILIMAGMLAMAAIGAPPADTTQPGSPTVQDQTPHTGFLEGVD